MDIRPLEDDAPLHRDVVLLLKCAKSVNWVIKAHSVIGRLDILVSWLVTFYRFDIFLSHSKMTYKHQ